MANHTDIQDDQEVTGPAADGAPFDVPAEVGPLDAFVADLDRLRRRAARGTGRTRISLEQLADATGIPRSTLHSYLRGQRLPPSDVLDRIVLALGATPVEQAGWAEMLDRLAVPGRRETAAPTAVPSTVTPTAPRAVPRLLPAAPGGFVGRTAELARLDEIVAAHDPTGAAPLVVCLTGTGGVGKTALALSWAHANADRFPDGQLWVDLRGYAPGAPLTPAEALERLLRAVDIGTTELPVDVDARADLFRSSLAGSRALIVLDNARNLAQVQPLLAGTSGIVTIVTSRDSLRSLAVSVGAIRVPVERLTDDDAVALMTARLPADAADSVRGSGLVEQCGGLPLALRIVRERLDPADPVDIRRLADDFAREKHALHASLELDDASVEVGVRSALDWSYEALPPEAARLFRRLPLGLSATLDVTLAAALLGTDTTTARRQVERLVSAHLLDPAGSDQVRLHDLVARYAWERLQRDESEDERSDARVRFYEYLLDRCERAASVWSDEVPWRIARVPADESSERSEGEGVVAGAWAADRAQTLASAITHALEQDALTYAYPLAERAFRAVFVAGSVITLERAITAASARAESGGDLAVTACLTGLLGVAFARSVRLDEAERAFDHVAELVEDLPADHQPGARRSLGNLALVWALRGQLRRAIDALTDLRAWAPDGPFAPWVLLALVGTHLQAGDIGAARIVIEEFDSIPDHINLWRSGLHEDPINFEIACGAWAAARERLAAFDHDSVELQLDAPRRVGALTLSARVDAAEGDLVRAETTVDSAVALARRSGCRSREMAAVSVRAEILALTGRADEAVLGLRPEVERSHELGLRYAECQTLSVLARALAAAGRDGEARTAGEQAGAIAAECGYGLLAREIAGEMPEPVSRAYLSW